MPVMAASTARPSSGWRDRWMRSAFSSRLTSALPPRKAAEPAAWSSLAAATPLRANPTTVTCVFFTFMTSSLTGSLP